jgi:hypothetical protein
MNYRQACLVVIYNIMESSEQEAHAVQADGWRNYVDSTKDNLPQTRFGFKSWLIRIKLREEKGGFENTPT